MKNYKLWVSSTLLLILLVLTFVGPQLQFVDNKLTEHMFIHTDSGKFLLPPFRPSAEFPFGTNARGVDMLSLIMVGAKETLLIVLSIVLVRYLIAIPIAIAAFYSKMVESVLKGWQQFFSFMPPIFFVTFIVALPILYFAENRSTLVVLVIAILETGRVAEIILENMKETKKRPYIEGGIVSGTPPLRMFRTYYFPVLVPHIIILVINDIGRTLFLIAQLGIVHVYVKHHFVSVGRGTYQVVNNSLAWPTIFQTITRDIYSSRWIPYSAISVIAATIFVLNMFSDGLQKVLENKYRTDRSDL